MFSARFPEKIGRWRKIRPHTHCSIEAGLIDVSKDSEGMVIGKKSGNSVDFTVFFFNVSKILCEITLQKCSAPFLTFFGKSAENSAADFLRY
jgi:hypothetical protein